MCFATLSEKLALALDTEMGETMILVSNTSESVSIRAYSFDTRIFSTTDIMIGSMVAMKHTCK
jgi:hypothetical protein